LEEVYESHSEIYLVQELCLGGELFDRLDEQPDYHYTEAQCARLVKQMLCSVRYIHSKGIIHRDLKLENFLFSDTGPDSELKMIDFGLSKHFKFGEVQHEAVGTPYTVAPEVIRGSYDERCDVWAIGVIAYLLLSGESPFGGCGGPEPLMQVRDNILRGSFVFEPEEIWANVSTQAKLFIRKLLVTDPNLRPTAREVQKEPWLINTHQSPDDKQLNPSVVKALVNFKEYSDMRKLLCEVLSFTLIPDQIQGLRSEFEKFDTDGSGEISLGALKSVLIGNAAQGSLGALTEEEVEDVFNAMRVSKNDTTIHWHEFIAAGLSHCKVDERNLRLAFDRLDADHTGYITFENFMDLIGNGAVHNEESLREMWGEAATHSDEAWLSYEDFLLLMKGQPTPSQLTRPSFAAKTPSVKTGMGLTTVIESVASSHEDEFAEKSLLRASTNSSPPTSAPSAPIGFMSPSFAEESDEDEANGPICMDDGDDVALNEGFLEAVRNQGKGFTIKDSLATPDSPESVKCRSKSFDEPSPAPNAGPPAAFLKGNTMRAINLPEHNRQNNNDSISTGDKPKTPLVVNRELYRAHRQMRLGVLEASKRLEEEQQRRAREEMRKEQARSHKGGAGLIMRHGGELSADAIKQFVVQRQKEEKKQIEKAVSKGGRRHNRNKTASDIRGMFGSPTTESNGNNQHTLPPIQRKKSADRAGAIPDFSNPPLTCPTPEKPSVVTGDLPEMPQMREATKPGQFRKTNYNPFSFGFVPESEAATAPSLMDSSIHRHIEGSLHNVIKPERSDDPLNRSSHSGTK
jgi:calcium-dependent protein kinase